MNPSSYLEDMVSTPVYMIRYNELSKMLNTQHKSVVCNTRIINHPIASAFITIQWCSRRSEHTSAVGSLITQLQPKSPSPTSSLPPTCSRVMSAWVWLWNQCQAPRLLGQMAERSEGFLALDSLSMMFQWSQKSNMGIIQQAMWSCMQ